MVVSELYTQPLKKQKIQTFRKKMLRKKKITFSLSIKYAYFITTPYKRKTFLPNLLSREVKFKRSVSFCNVPKGHEKKLEGNLRNNLEKR